MKRTGSAGIGQVLNGRDLGTELRRRFSFTRSEANIALLLAEGLAYAEIAERLEISYHTVHTHVKAIHRKARVSSNGRLLALIRGVEGA
jgi:DNA-binding CsgD family transcriptional regulator